MPDLSAADIAEGRRLDDAATRSPWGTDPHAHLEKGCRCLCCHDSPTVTHTTNMLYCEDIPVPDGADQTRCDQPGYTWTDAELIVWARNHLPALLDAAERLDRVTDLFEKWAAEESEHRTAGEYGLAEGLHVAIEELRIAVHGKPDEETDSDVQ